MSKLERREGRHDHYFHQARKEHFASRAVFKLKAIDERFKLLRPGMRVLDLGCRPGSWLQHAAERVGPSGRVVGIDRSPVDLALPRHVTTLVRDVYEITPAGLLGDLAAYDVVLSDMAPDTTGIKFTDAARSVALVERALEIAGAVLVPGGAMVAKVFVGEGFDPLLAAVKAAFRRVKMIKPDSSRKESPEQYIVAQDRKPPAG